MPSIRKRGTVWQAQVRRSGHPTITRSFDRKGDATAWARETERDIDRLHLPVDFGLLRRTTVRDVLVRYRDTVTPTKRGAVQEAYKVRHLLRHPISCLSLEKLTPALIADYRDQRLKSVQGNTVQRELAVLRHALEMAMKEWGMPLSVNPVRQIRLPAGSRPRDRRLRPGEFETLVEGARNGRTVLLEPVIRVAVETGLRRSELISLKWEDLSSAGDVIAVHETKNGHRRRIPLTPEAKRVLSSLPRADDRVFPITGNAVRLAWERLKKRLGLDDLHFHDLRHEAISRFFEMGLSVPEVALISGHRDPRMLFRYTHVQAAKVAVKLQEATRQGPSEGGEGYPCAS
ncbi:MAG: tyrosine-type recombinase/integrase [Alphaproteobacteria bacterium]|nr:tyrosine-type recombinase/integrase [Alphaproteobacteria bacterium]